MGNQLLSEALDQLEASKAQEEKLRAERDAARQDGKTGFITYRDKRLIPLLSDMKDELEARGYNAQVIRGEDFNPPLHDAFVELRFAGRNRPIVTGGPTIIFLWRNGIEFITIDKRPASINLTEHRGRRIDTDQESPEELVKNYIIDKLA